MMTATLTPLGELLEQARGQISKREAARRAGISEGRWRQIVTGQQKAGAGIIVPANPRRETVIAMASAVKADVRTALALAGFATEDARVEPVERYESDALFGAIENHPRLLPEAKQHLRNQIELLLRIASPVSATDSQPSVEAPPDGDSRKKASQARMDRLRADVRGQQRPGEKERERGTGTQGDG